MTRAVAIAVFLLVSLVVCLAVARSAAAASGDAVCANRTFEGATFTVCGVNLARHDVRLFLNKPDGTRYAQLEALPRDKLLFATNAGMFTPAYEPAGLYIENGAAIRPLVTRKGAGNFHLEPNGVFYIASGRAGVATTAAYAKSRPRAQLATQSGPMLVINGKLHPRFDDDGPSRTLRSGVGVRNGRQVYFAISQGPVSFGVFARLFRDALACPNALYLDGSISRLYQPGGPPSIAWGAFGPMFGVYRR